MPPLSSTLATADDLNAFADKEKAAEELLPIILRRLVLASVNSAEELNFPTGKSINEGWWDGHVKCPGGRLFVPAGISGWELTARADQKGKADEDWAAREGIDPAEKKNTTFIHWNFRKWRDREKWAESRRNEGKWLEVQAYDAKDLETWLVDNQAIHIWVSRLIGKKPDGVLDIFSFWEDWSITPDKPLIPAIVTAGYENQQKQLIDALLKRMSVISLQWEKPELAAAFVAATLANSNEPEVEKLALRSVYVKTEQAFDELAAEHKDLILMPKFTPSELGIARKNGHTVISPLGRDAPGGAEIILAGRRPTQLFEAMAPWEANDERRRAAAERAVTNFTSFYRSLIPPGTIQPPPWAEAENIPLLLTGTWDAGYEGDREILERMTGRSFDAENSRAIGLSRSQDALFNQDGTRHSIVDFEDAWTFLSRGVDDNHLNAFESAILTVFEEVDPQYTIEDSKESELVGMFENRQGKLRYSMALRGGLAANLCYLGACGSEINVNGQRKGSIVALLIVRKLFAQADSWQRLCSIAPWFTAMAEASPEEFLSALERDISGDPAKVRELFRDRDDGSFFMRSSSPHTALLWALEILAWSPTHLTRVALLLAKLAKIDPGGKLSNRPLSSLRGIFLTWLPGTLAPIDHQINALQAINRYDSEIAWSILTEVLPTGHSIAMPTASAKYRPWGQLWRVAMNRVELRNAVEMVSLLFVESAGDNVGRLIAVLKSCTSLTKAAFASLVERLAHFADIAAHDSSREAMREALRQLIAQHKAHPGADWVLSPERLNSLEDVLTKLTPASKVDEWHWVFLDHAIFELGPGNDFEAKQRQLDELQLRAVREVFGAEGVAGLVALSERTPQSWKIGMAVVNAGLQIEPEPFIISSFGHSPSGIDLAVGFVGRKAEIEGRKVVWDLLQSEWGSSLSPDLKVRLLRLLPIDQQTFEDVNAMPREVQQAFWTFFGAAHMMRGDEELAPVILQRLREFDCYATALVSLSYTISAQKNVSVSEILDTIEGALKSPRMTVEGWNQISYELGELLDYLDAQDDVDVVRLGRLELQFASLLWHTRKPKRLNKVITEDPALFIHLLRSVYGPDEKSSPSETVSDDKEEQTGIPPMTAYEVLDSLEILPGQRSDGSIDQNYMIEWVKKARSLASEAQRLGAFEDQLGQWFAKSPSGSDGIFPHEAVREVFQMLESETLESAFHVGVMNGRGVVTKGPEDGGEQEHDLAAKFKKGAELLASRWHRVSIALQSIADSYEEHAQREDRRAGR